MLKLNLERFSNSFHTKTQEMNFTFIVLKGACREKPSDITLFLYKGKAGFITFHLRKKLGVFCSVSYLLKMKNNNDLNAVN